MIIDVEERVINTGLDLGTINTFLGDKENEQTTQDCLTLLGITEDEPTLAQRFKDVFSKFQTVDVPARLVRFQQLQELRLALIQHFTATGDSPPSTRRRRTGRTDVQP